MKIKRRPCVRGTAHHDEKIKSIMLGQTIVSKHVVNLDMGYWELNTAQRYHCLYGSARPVVMGHIRFKGKGVIS